MELCITPNIPKYKPLMFFKTGDWPMLSKKKLERKLSMYVDGNGINFSLLPQH